MAAELNHLQNVVQVQVLEIEVINRTKPNQSITRRAPKLIFSLMLHQEKARSQVDAGDNIGSKRAVWRDQHAVISHVVVVRKGRRRRRFKHRLINVIKNPTRPIPQRSIRVSAQ
jgi:hypothetical protein